jgi:filamentous hemagglutinin family protein
MMHSTSWRSWLMIIWGLLMTIPSIAQAQIAEDGTLGTNVGNVGLDFTITGGTTAGTNLFHSFSEFSVPTGGSVTFNSPGIQNIFSRVTGGNISVIDGAIAANANLFLLNPAGITFGSGATLNINGSFFASTASGVLFGGGIAFTQASPVDPLLMINSPIGLDFSSSDGNIQVNGPGHNYTIASVNFTPYLPGGAPQGLQLTSGGTFALLGQHITLKGGIVAAPDGQMVVAGVQTGTVGLTSVGNQWTLTDP